METAILVFVFEMLAHTHMVAFNSTCERENDVFLGIINKNMNFFCQSVCVYQKK